LGLLFGVYGDAGIKTCGTELEQAGSLGMHTCLIQLLFYAHR
jgi:hypothetical protein